MVYTMTLMVLLSFWSGFMYESWDGKTFPQPLPTYTTRIIYLHFGCLSQVVYPNCPDFLNYLYYLKLFNKFCKKKKILIKKKNKLQVFYRYFKNILSMKYDCNYIGLGFMDKYDFYFLMSYCMTQILFVD